MTPSRRDFLKSAGVVGAAAVAANAAPGGTARAQAASAQDGVRTVRTSVLEIGYEESGDSAGFPIILLHGFPYDIRAWDGVVPALAEAGYRVLVPYLRGYGPTRFLDPDAPRMAEQAAIRPGRRRLRRRAGDRAGRAGRFRLGQPRGVHHVHPASGARAGPGGHGRLLGAGHRFAVAAVSLGPRRGAPLVPVVLQHRARPRRPRGAPPRHHPLPGGRRGRRPGSTPTRRTTARRRRSTTPTSSTS